MTKFVEPEDIVVSTEICPELPSGMIALLVRAELATKLIALARGGTPPAGKRRTFPTVVWSTVAALTATAFASLGTLHRPPTEKLLVEPASSAGPWPARVSTRRQGVTVKKLPQSAALSTVTVVVPEAVPLPQASDTACTE